MPLIFEADDEIAPSAAENLYSLLYELKLADRLPDFYEMFNSDVCLHHLIKPNEVALQPLRTEYQEQFSSRCVVVDGIQYIHLSEFGTTDSSKRKLQRAYEKLPQSACKQYTECSVHPGRGCKLLKFEYGFLCFLQMLPAAETAKSTEAGSSRVSEFEVFVENEVHEEVGTIDEVQERLDAEQQLFPATSSLDLVEVQDNLSVDVQSLEHDGQRHSELGLPQLPYFCMENGFDYVLMTDVQHHFHIREDYCFAALAQYCDADKDFVDSICDKYLLLDTDCDDAKYQSGQVFLQRFLNEAKAYEQTLPASEEDFNATLRRLGLENMGRESSEFSNTQQGSSTSSVPLWMPNLLEDDENQLVFVEEDTFLKRASGTRRGSGSSSSAGISYRKDAALKEYLKSLDHTKVFIFHKDLSKDAANFPLFALKVLSKFSGGYDVPQNAHMVVLIERQFDIRVFGQGLYCQALRAPYYIAYAAQALILGIADAEQLPVYGKRFLMRSRKLRIAPYMLPLPPPLSPEHVSTPPAPGLQFEEDESMVTEERAQKRQKSTSDQH